MTTTTATDSKLQIIVKAEIEKVKDNFLILWKKGDHVKLSKLYTEDCSVLAPDTPPTYNQAGAAKINGRQIQKGFANLALNTLEMEAATADLVVERGAYKYANKDKQILETGKYVMVWKRMDSDLRIHIHIWNRNA